MGLNKKGEGMQALYSWILMFVMIGMMIGIAVLVFQKFGEAAYSNTAVVNESITYPADTVNVTFAHGNITSFTSVINASSAAVPSANYTLYTTDGKLRSDSTNGTCYDGLTCYVSYSYDEYNTKTAQALADMVSATTPLASTWLPLIITVLVLAIILTIVIASFARRE